MIAPGANAAAAAPQLRVAVSAATVRPHQRYAITVTGRYGLVASGAPHMLAFLQYSRASCKRTATAEYRLPGREWDWVFGHVHQQAEDRSPFKAVADWTAGTGLGRRRVCAYLYWTDISPQSTVKPVATASASFRNI